MTRQVNDAGVALVKQFEGCTLEAYKCPAGIWSIGYGHTLGVRKGMVISQEAADDFLRLDLLSASAAVERRVHVKLNDNQHAALCSFVYNLGEGTLAGSNLLRRLNSGDYDGVPQELSRWVHATVDGEKVVLPGLVCRRTEECALWKRPGSGDTVVVPRRLLETLLMKADVTLQDYDATLKILRGTV